jgi:16S rRNA (uracil1498-N3)-methyltransferase
LTELGAAAIVPLVTEQTVVRPKQERVGARQDRWQRIALEAAQQSERWDVPVVDGPREAEAFFATPGLALKLILSEREAGQALTAIPLPALPAEAIALAVGPEGGWRAEELAAARAHHFIPVTLGTLILRAETAALAATSVIQSRLGELG